MIPQVRHTPKFNSNSNRQIKQKIGFDYKSHIIFGVFLKNVRPSFFRFKAIFFDSRDVCFDSTSGNSYSSEPTNSTAQNEFDKLWKVVQENPSDFNSFSQLVATAEKTVSSQSKKMSVS
jgi:hypothetical protein